MCEMFNILSRVSSISSRNCFWVTPSISLPGVFILSANSRVCWTVSVGKWMSSERGQHMVAKPKTGV